MNKEDISSTFQELENGKNEIQEVLQLRKEQSATIALQELKNVLNDSEKDDLTTPFNIDPRCIDLLLGEYQKGIDSLQKKYISSGSFENMLERIFSVGNNKDEILGMLDKELVLQENLIDETGKLEDTLEMKKQLSQKILDAIRRKNSENFNSKETRIQELLSAINEKLLVKAKVTEIFAEDEMKSHNNDDDDDSSICDVFDEEFISAIDDAIKED